MAITTANVLLEDRYEQDPKLKALLNQQDKIKDKLFSLKDEIYEKLPDEEKKKFKKESKEGKSVFKKDDFDNFINFTAEGQFNDFLRNIYESHKNIFADNVISPEEKKLLEDEFNEYLNGLFANGPLKELFDQLQQYDELEMQKGLRFELNDLKFESETGNLKRDIYSSNPLLADKEFSTTETKETRDQDNTYGYKPENFSMTELGDKGRIEYPYEDIDLGYNNEDLINIFKKGGLQKHVEKIIGQGLGGLDAKTFKINLSPENGLSGLIAYVEKNNLRGEITSAKDIKELANRTPAFEYNRDGGLDNERKKIALIIQTANDSPDFQQQLIGFAEQAKAYGTSYEKRFKQEINFTNNLESITSDNVLQALCDFNGDGKMAVDLYQYRKRKEFKETRKKEHEPLPYNRKKLVEKAREAEKQKNKKEREKGKNIDNLGDVGTIFGPQLYDAIHTASNVLETRIKYNDKAIIERYGADVSGENIVIFNIFKTIRSFNQNKNIKEMLEPLTVQECTKDKLNELCQTYPSFQPLFAKAIEMINGSSSQLAPDLADRLSGVERMQSEEKKENGQEYPSFSDKTNALLTDRSKTTEVGKNFVAEYHEEGLLQMRAGIMTLFDNVNLNAMLSDKKLLSLGIDKSRDIEKNKHELENSFLKTLLGGLVNVTFDGFPPSVGFRFGKKGASTDLQKLRGRNVDISNVLLTGIIKVSVGGEYAQQFNYPLVVTSSLDDIASSQYAGVGGGAAEVFMGVVPVVSILEGGIAYKNNRKAAIEQMYKQYNAVTKVLFDIDNSESKKLRKATENDVSSKNNFTKYLERRYENLYTSLSTSKNKNDNLMAQFLENNNNILKENIKQLTTYLDVNGVFNAVKDGADKKIEATKKILNIFQGGLTNEWRETMYERIAGTTQISKVSVGVTAMLIAQTIPMLTPKFTFQITHWRNNYLNNKGQKLLDAKLIGGGGIEKKFDVFTPEPPSIEAYAEYIKAIFNIPGKVKDKQGNEIQDENGNTIDILETGKNAQGFLYIKYNGTEVNRLIDIIDVRAKVKQDVLDNIQMSEDGRTLTLGDVGNITAYTQADGIGKRCFLILGGEGAENTTRINPSLHNLNTPKQNIALDRFDGTYKTREKEKLQSEIIGKLAIENTKDREMILRCFAADGTIQNPDIPGVTLLDNKLIGKKLSTGTLIIEKSLDGKTLMLTYRATPADKLSIEYKDMNIYTIEKKTDLVVKKDFESKDLLINFDGNLLAAKKAIDKIYANEKLANLEKITNTDKGALKKEFKQFLKATLEENVGQAKTALIVLLKDQKFNAITKLLSEGDEKTQSYIIDRFMAVFAFENHYEQQPLGKTLSERTHYSFTILKGPSKIPLAETVQKEIKDLRDAYRDGHMTTSYNDPKLKGTVNNLFGYTGFYRTSLSTDYHGYALMSLGTTNILNDSVSLIKDQKEAKKWLIENMKKEGPEKAILLDNIKKMLPSEDAQGFDETNMLELLEKGEIKYNNKTMKMEKEAVFYLMAECVNESIGLKIKSLKVEETRDEKIYKKYSSIAEGVQNKGASTTIAGRGLSSSMRVGSYAEEAGIDLSLVKTEKKSADTRSQPGLLETEDSDANSSVGLE